MEDGRYPLQLWLLQRVLGVKVDRHVVLFAEDRLVGGADTFYTLAGVADQVLFRRVTLGADDMDEIAPIRQVAHPLVVVAQPGFTNVERHVCLGLVLCQVPFAAAGRGRLPAFRRATGRALRG